MAELFAPQKANVLTVAQVNREAKALLERSFARLAVVGEVSNLKVVSGHWYMVLKDDEAQLPAVLFRRDAEALRFKLQGGMEVVARGRLTLYGAYGRYQMVIDTLEPRGAGALALAFEQLKQKLVKEGLFAAERKRRLPALPGRVAVVTSPTGAVIRDIVNVATRRFPNARILVVPTRVQGAESAPAIAQAIARASELGARGEIDVCIVARGGGSLEDLWGFNDEAVARAIAACAVPVVSAVGHETDTTIADFVADCRAPTPSAAAELVFPMRHELAARLRRPLERGARALKRELVHERQRLVAAHRALGDGRWLFEDRAEALAEQVERSEHALRELVHAKRARLSELETRLAHLHPRVRLREVAAALDGNRRRLILITRQRLSRDRHRLAALGQRLHALSPLAVLDRGYGIVLGPRGQAVKSPAEVGPGDRLRIKVAEGDIHAKVEPSGG